MPVLYLRNTFSIGELSIYDFALHVWKEVLWQAEVKIKTTSRSSFELVSYTFYWSFVVGAFLVLRFQLAMQGFVSKIVNLMKENQLFAWQGGPVIMAQVEGGEWIIGQYMSFQLHLAFPYRCSLWLWLRQYLDMLWVQIENEYGNIEWEFGDGGKRYVQWAADMALSLDARVPWVMCQQGDAPGNIVRPLLIFV